MRLLQHFFLVVALGTLMSCGGLHYSTTAYNDDMAIKNTAMALIQKSNEPYSSHATEVEALKADVLRALGNEKARKGNSATVALWNEVINAKGNLFDLLNLWKTNNQLSAAMTSESSAQIEKLLTNITELESNKKK